MTTAQNDRFKAWAFWLAVIAAVAGWGKDLVGDRYGVGDRLTRIEVKVDSLSEAVVLIANQRERISGLEAEVDEHARRLDRYEVRINSLERN